MLKDISLLLKMRKNVQKKKKIFCILYDIVKNVTGNFKTIQGRKFKNEEKIT